MVLKRIPEEVLQIDDIRPVRLWLDDLEELHEILSGDDSVGVRIEADGRLADNIEDLTQLPDDRIRYLKLERRREGEGRELAVEITERRIMIWAHHPDNDIIGLAHRIAGRLRRRQRRSRVPPMLLGLLLLMLLGIPAVAPLREAVESDTPRFVLSGAVGVVVGVAGGIWSSASHGSIVLTRRRRESPGFLQRNKDHIWLMVISSALSLVVGFILGKLS